jgi:hypothetical protein
VIFGGEPNLVTAGKAATSEPRCASTMLVRLAAQRATPYMRARV